MQPLLISGLGPLLQAIARQQEDAVVLDYLDAPAAGVPPARVCLTLSSAGAQARGVPL
jgi:hypothetical protein